LSDKEKLLLPIFALLIIIMPIAFADENEYNNEDKLPTFEQVNHLDRVFQAVFDNDSNSFFSSPKVIFVSPGMKSLQPRGPSVLDPGSTFTINDTRGITAKLIGAKTPKVYGTGTGIVCGDKLCMPHPFKSEFDALRKKIKFGNTAEVMMILDEISSELATKYPTQSVQLQGHLSAVMMPASDEKQSRILKDVDIICEGKVWLESIKGKLACTFPSTAMKLVERGWGKILE